MKLVYNQTQQDIKRKEVQQVKNNKMLPIPERIMYKQKTTMTSTIAFNQLA